MNADRLLAHFNRLAEAPDAVPRLRRFVLDLATCGKLIAGDEKDEPALELLHRIRAEASPEANRKRMGEEHGRPKDNELGYELPPRWARANLGEVIELVSGQHLTPGEYTDAPGPLPYVTGPADFAPGGLAISRYAKVRKAVAKKGHILLTVKGAGVGKTAECNLPEVAISRQLMALSPIGWDRDFLLLVTHRLADALKEQARSLIPGISREDISRFIFGLPPLAEQRRIVAKVDELMALCNRMEAAQAERESRRDRLVSASLHRLNQPAEDATAFRDDARFALDHMASLTTRPEHIPQLRQTILDLAVRGKLVAQDPRDEPASDLLSRLRVQKDRLTKAGQIKRWPTRAPVKAEGIPFELPVGWKWVRFSELLRGDSQNGYSRKPDDAPDGIPILRISAGTVREDGIVAEEEHKLIGNVTEEHRERYALERGDLLACRFNGNRSFVGRLSLYLGYLGINPIYPDKLIRLRLFSDFALPQVVRYFAESSTVRQDIESYCATTVGNWGISASNLKDVKIPLPPVAEQHRILAKLDQTMALCDRLEAQLTTARTESGRLLESVLHEALAPAA